MNKEKVKRYLLTRLESLRAYKFNTHITKVDLDENGFAKSLISQAMFDLFTISSLKEEDFQINSYSKEDKLLFNFFTGYLFKAKTIDFIDEYFYELYQELEHLISTNKYIFHTIGMFQGFRVSKKVNFEPFEIIPINKEYGEFIYNFWERLRQNYSPSYGIDHLLSLSARYSRSSTIIVCHEEGEEYSNIQLNRTSVESIIKSIILSNGVQNEFILSPLFTFSYLTSKQKFFATHYFNSTVDSLTIHNQNFNLKSEEEVENIYLKLQKIKSDFLPIDRIHSAFLKEKQIDKYIDLMIALEAVFPKVQTEAKLRLALNCASILGFNKNVFDEILQLYGLRSDLVHGNKSKLKAIEENLRKLDIITRNTVLKVVDLIGQGTSLESIESNIYDLLLPNKNEIF